MTRIEKGAPGTAVGTVLEAALLCGVPLYGLEPGRMGEARELAQARLALLPQRVRPAPLEVPDDF